MKTLGLVAAAAVGLAGVAFAGGADGPSLMTDGQLDQIVAGKKPQSGNGNGTDTGGGDTFSNYVYEYDHANKDQNVYQDYDAGISTNKNLTCLSYGYIDASGNYVYIGDCYEG